MNGFPRPAAALLKACAVNPALIGDLEEAAQAGRSRAWCWRQVAYILCCTPQPRVTRVALLVIALYYVAMAVVLPALNS